MWYLRRMQRFAEFLHYQRLPNGHSADRSYSRQFPGGIYSRLEAQWRISTGNLGPIKTPSAQAVKKHKQTPSLAIPFR
ncbi:hypothetical protein D915_006024 [Fasciola hepatica]|uniref:Uncharacterized protein n=1 Tax=Fasciola hepatica TaxID=6192 RepID=A0A4E0RB99_FASHE|nr:hypothetical protein D915_006024 [Fasciola hepatica]